MKNTIFVTLILVTVAFGFTGIAQAQQYGIGRFEQIQILAHDLEATTRTLVFRMERRYRSRAEFYAVNRLRELHQSAILFRNQVERHFDHPTRIQSSFRQLVSAHNEAEYAFSRLYGYSYHYRDLRNVSHLVNRLSQTFYAYPDWGGYGDRHEGYGADDYEDDRHDYYPDDDYDDDYYADDDDDDDDDDYDDDDDD